MKVVQDIPSYVRCRQKCEATLMANRCHAFAGNLKEVSEDELFAPGHRACAGCGCAIAMRLATKALGKNTIAAHATGCMEVVSSPYPQVAWRFPWIHVAFENAAAVASGIEAALKALGRKEGVNVVAFGGDGGTVDIGLQALSGAMERGHDMTYICYDNEAYMNTGVQRSASTPLYASATTSPAGKVSFGEDRPKKDMAPIIAAHGVPYVATASIAFPLDYMEKVKRATQTKGPSYIHVFATCPIGWGSPGEKSVELARLAVESGLWVLYEVVDGEWKVTYKPTKKVPVSEYLTFQRRYRHLTEEKIAELQAMVDERWKNLFDKE